MHSNNGTSIGRFDQKSSDKDFVFMNSTIQSTSYSYSIISFFYLETNNYEGVGNFLIFFGSNALSWLP